jgi:hypothetical protein
MQGVIITVEMIVGIIGLVLAIIGWFAGSWLSAYFGNKKAAEEARVQKAKEDAAIREAHLRNLREELTFNRKLLWEARTYVSGGPPIPQSLNPTATTCERLRFSAWDALIRAGVLAGLAPTDQALFGVVERAGRKAAQDVLTLRAVWLRALEWQEWNRNQQAAGEIVQGIPLRSMLQDTQKQVKDSLTYAIERTDAALA